MTEKIEVNVDKWKGRDFIDFETATGLEVYAMEPPGDLAEVSKELEELEDKDDAWSIQRRAELDVKKKKIEAFRAPIRGLFAMAWIEKRRTVDGYTFDQALDELELDNITTMSEPSPADPLEGAG